MRQALVIPKGEAAPQRIFHAMNPKLTTMRALHFYGRNETLRAQREFDDLSKRGGQERRVH
jgi:hypothetical protein